MLFIQSYINLYSQDSANNSRHYFGFSIGNIQTKDENLIPKVHSGLINMISYRYERISSSYNLFDFNLGYGLLKTKIEKEAVSFNCQLALSYCYNLSLIRNDFINYYLGPKISFTSSLAEYGVFDEAHAYWGNFLSLCLSNVSFISIDPEKDLVFNLDISIIGLYTRPEYNRLYSNEYWTFSNIIDIMNSNYKFGFLNNAFQFKASAEYRTQIWNSNDLSLALSVYYSRIKDEAGKPLTELIPKISLGIWL